MSKTIEVTRVTEYLDSAINHWVENYKRGKEPYQLDEARIYIDAFQAARESLLGEKLPINA